MMLHNANSFACGRSVFAEMVVAPFWSWRVRFYVLPTALGNLGTLLGQGFLFKARTAMI